jgi:DNA replication protein DnaC
MEQLTHICATTEPYWKLSKQHVIRSIRTRKGMSPVGPCPLCDSLEVINDREKGEMYCLCYIVEWQGNLRDQLKPYRSSLRKDNTFDTYKTDLWDSRSKEVLKGIYNSVKEWSEWPDRWIYMTGGYGTGKTHLAQAAAWALGPTALYIEAAKLKTMLMDAVGTKSNDLDALTVSKVERDVKTAHILILDDWGGEYDKSEFAKDELYLILNWRYNLAEHFPVFVVTNRTEREAIDEGERSGSRLLDKQIANRLRFPAWVPDYRTKGGE